VRLQLRLVTRKSEEPEIEVMAEDITELRAMNGSCCKRRKFEAIGQLAGELRTTLTTWSARFWDGRKSGYDSAAQTSKLRTGFCAIREQGERAASLTRNCWRLRDARPATRIIDLNSVAGGLLTFLDRVIGKDVELKRL